MTIPSNSSGVHCLADYCAMFDLSESDLARSILDYPGQISCFNAEMYTKGHKTVVSADRHYDLAPLDMIKHVGFVIQNLSESLANTPEQIHPEVAEELDELLNRYNYYAQIFLKDYSDGQQDGRYQVARLPHLPYEAAQFELALCSNLIFRTPQFTPQDVVNELVRVAKEVRIFPLLNLKGEIAEELGPLMLSLQQMNFGIEVKEVSYQLHKKSNAMLRIWAKACAVT